MLTGWTVSYGQVLIDSKTGDTLAYYNTKTLRELAEVVTYANECDSLYNLQTLELISLDSSVYIKNLIINDMNNIITQKDLQIEKRDKHIDNFQLMVESKDRKIKWLKLGWATTSIAAGGAILYLLVR